MTTQNATLLEILVDANSVSITLPEDRFFANRKVKAITLLSNAECAKSPNGIQVVPESFLKNVFIDCNATSGRVIFKNLSVSHLRQSSNQPIQINELIDYKSTQFKVVSNSLAATYAMIVVIEYQTHNLSLITETSNCETGIISSAQANSRVSLYDLFGYKIKSNSINRIVVISSATSAFLTLVCTDGKAIEQMPINMLSPFVSTENRVFDNLNIDFDKSFLFFSENLVTDIKIHLFHE